MLRPAVALVTVAFALSILTSADAAAAAQRTFVASYGNDANPCSLTLPCRGFAAAVSQTNAGGEVIVLDSAGYGPVTIAQSVSIIAPPGVYAGIAVPTGGTGVDIDGAGIRVALRGLTIAGTGAIFGIRLLDGSALVVENCAISNFGTDSSGAGVIIEAPATVTIARTTVSNSYVGISVHDGATVNVTQSQIIESVHRGIWNHGSGNSGTTTSLFITDTLVSGGPACIENEIDLIAVQNTAATRVTATGCGAGFSSVTGTMTVSDSMVTGNFTGFFNQYGVFQSHGNNHLSGNSADTVGTITTIGGK